MGLLKLSEHLQYVHKIKDKAQQFKWLKRAKEVINFIITILYSCINIPSCGP